MQSLSKFQSNYLQKLKQILNFIRKLKKNLRIMQDTQNKKNTA